MRTCRLLECLSLLLVLVAAGCSGSNSTNGATTRKPGNPSLLCVATTGMVGDLVRNVCGSRVEVVDLMSPDVDPHLFTPSPRDVKLLSQADIVFYSGLHLEAGLQDTLEKMARTKPIFAVTTHLLEKQDPRLIQLGEHVYDPHVWGDVSLWSECGAFVAAKLAEVDPNNALLYDANAKAYAEILGNLHMELTETAASIPEEKRVLITAHDAFNYFGKAYGFRVEGIQGISTQSEASVARINELVGLICDREIGAVFAESSVNPKTVTAIVEGCRFNGWNVRQLGPLYSDAMGQPGSDADTYVKMVGQNMQLIQLGLQ